MTFTGNFSDEILRQFKAANVKLIVTIPVFIQIAAILKNGLSGYRGTVCIGGENDANENVYGFKTLLMDDHSADLPTVSPDDVAVIPFSSGTSGLPKGVLLTHRNCIANIEQAGHARFSKYHTDNRKSTEAETILTIPPFFHIYGFNGTLNVPIKEGSQVVTIPKFVPEDYIKALVEHKPNILFVVPALLQFLAGHPSVRKEMLESVEQVVVGAAAASVQLQEKFKTKCQRDVHILHGYGMTETSPATLLTPLHPLPGKSASVGQLFPNTEARIISLITGKTLGPNQSGEIHFRGPQVHPTTLTMYLQ